MNARQFLQTVLLATLSHTARADGLIGQYGFLSSAVLGPQSEAAIRARITTMARDYGIREFQFYDWFADYSTPVSGDHWPTPYFQKGQISRHTIEISIDEIHRQGGRAWAYVQSIGSEEKNLEDPAKQIWKLRNAVGQWHWHPPGSEKPRFPTYFANAAWAEHMVNRWARRVKQLGFDGIHWDTLGRIAGDYGAETAGIHAFMRTTRPLLARYGLRQTINLVDMAWWDRAVVRENLEFPYVESWSDTTTKRYYSEMDQPDMAGKRGVIAMYATTAVPAGMSASELVCARHAEARRHNLVYLIVGDGARRMKTEYWPDTVPLSEYEISCLRE
ncbi:MAG: glycoside hydrolase family 66 protein [Verrucomicrobiota bacterium]